MAKIRKIYDQTIKPDGSKTTIYPITSIRAVYAPDGSRLDEVLANLHVDLPYIALDSTSDLPLEENHNGYLIGENLYVWVGAGGDTLDGKYQNCGPFKGPRGTVLQPDNEDIRGTEANTLQLADRNNLEGMGYKILRRNKSFKQQVDVNLGGITNTIYEIRYNFDLEGEEVTIPEGCILNFEGGKISNGTLVGDNTGIGYSGTIFSNVTISGTWLVPEIKSSMFANCTSRNTLKSLFALQNSNIQNRVIVEKDADNYLVSFTSGNILTVRSNTEVILNGSIELEPTDVTGYNILHLTGNNIKVSGGGSIIGDKEDHDYSSGGTHEWGFGIRIWNDCKDVIIDGLEISECTGDGIYQNSAGESQPENIVIRNVTIHDCRRQGITLMGIANCIIENFNIYNIVGTDPRSAIDIEPNGASGPSTTSGVIIRNGLIDNVYYGIISSKQEDPSTHQEYEHTVFKDIDISNITITNCRMTAIQTYKFERAKISNCSISNKVYGINVQGGLVDIKNCSISTEAMEKSGVYTGTCVFNISSTVNVNNCRLDGYNAVRTMNGVNISNSIITTSAGFNQLETGSTSKGSIMFSTITCAGFIKGLAPLVLKNNTINCNKIALGRDSVIEQNVMEGNATSLTDNFIGPVDGYTPKFIVKDNNITVTDAKYKYLIHVLANTKSIVYGNVISGNNYSGTGQGRFIGVATGNFISNFSGYPSYGALTSRPVFDTNNAADDSIVGLVYFDTTNNRPIWHKGNNVWVDATGTVIN